MLATIKLGTAAGLVIVAGLFGGGVTGNGKVKEETREVGEFSGVEVGYSIEATVTIGPKTSVKLEGEENLLPLIKTEVKNGVLTTRVDGKDLNPTRPVRLTIVTPKLTSAGASGAAMVTADATPGPKFEADASGASHLTVRGVSADQLEVDASGAAHLTVSGSAKTINLDASGAAQVNLGDTSADSLRVDASGAAMINAQAKSDVNVDASGGAQVRVKGGAKNKTVDRSGGANVQVD
jgi:hypothetical protein